MTAVLRGNLLLSYQVVVWLKGVFNERKWFSEYSLKRIAEQTQAANRKTHFLLELDEKINATHDACSSIDLLI